MNYAETRCPARIPCGDASVMVALRPTRVDVRQECVSRCRLHTKEWPRSIARSAAVASASAPASPPAVNARQSGNQAGLRVFTKWMGHVHVDERSNSYRLVRCDWQG